MPPGLARALEIAAGLMLFLLGASVLRRAVRPVPAVPATAGMIPRALLVGGVHGMEGSAAVVVAMMPGLRSPLHAVATLALFGLGTIAGMVACSLAVAVPLRFSLPRLKGAGRGIQLALGASSMCLGAWFAFQAV